MSFFSLLTNHAEMIIFALIKTKPDSLTSQGLPGINTAKVELLVKSDKYRNTFMAKITVLNTDITIVQYNEEDYISLTDMARSQMQEHIIFRWLSLKSTLEYLGEWEMLYNPNFNCTEFSTIKNAAGSNNFVLSVKTWI